MGNGGSDGYDRGLSRTAGMPAPLKRAAVEVKFHSLDGTAAVGNSIWDDTDSFLANLTINEGSVNAVLRIPKDSGPLSGADVGVLQSLFGKLGDFECNPDLERPPTGSQGSVYSLTFKNRTGLEKKYVLKVQSFPLGKKYKYDKAVAAEGTFRSFGDYCDIVRAKMWPIELPGVGFVLLTMMEKMDEDVFDYLAGHKFTSPPKFALGFANFVGTVLRCLRDNDATFSDFKLENVGHLFDPKTSIHHFRLIDLDSVNSLTFTPDHQIEDNDDIKQFLTSTDPGIKERQDRFLWHTTTYAALVSLVLVLNYRVINEMTKDKTLKRQDRIKRLGDYLQFGIQREYPEGEAYEQLHTKCAELWATYGEPLSAYVVGDDFWMK